MFLHVLDHKGKPLFEQDLLADPAAFLRAIKPFRKDLVVGVECMFAWYWLADLCEDHGIPFALGRALAMKHIHQGKSKSDRIDTAKLAANRHGLIVGVTVTEANGTAERQAAVGLIDAFRDMAGWDPATVGLDKGYDSGDLFLALEARG